MKKLLLAFAALLSLSAFAQNSPMVGNYVKVSGSLECPAGIKIIENEYIVEGDHGYTLTVANLISTGQPYEVASYIEDYYKDDEYFYSIQGMGSIEVQAFKKSKFFSPKLLMREYLRLAPKGERTYDLYVEVSRVDRSKVIACRFKRK